MRKERFNKAFNHLKGLGIIKTQKKAAETIGIDTGNLSNALKGIDKYLTDSFLEKFNNAFNDIFNIEWLITGSGNMLKNISDTTQVGEPQAPYGNSEDYITIPREVWDMLRSQMKQIEERNRQIDKIIDMLEAERNKNF